MVHRCSLCEATFNCKQALQRHTDEMHEEKKKKCLMCDFTHVRGYIVNRHMKKVHSYNTCCGLVFDNLLEYEGHCLSHTKPKLHCDEHNITFKNKYDKYYHMNVFHRNTSCICSTCGKSFTKKSSLNAHTKRYH